MQIDANQIFEIVFRVLVIYVIVLAGLRLFGKREIAQLSVVDFVFVLLISNAVQNAMIGEDTTLFGGIVAAITLFCVNLLLKLAEKFGLFNNLLEGKPVLLIYKGDVNHKNLKKAGISITELEAVVREHGVKDIKEVDLGILEITGNISILSHDYTARSEKIVLKNKQD